MIKYCLIAVSFLFFGLAAAHVYRHDRGNPLVPPPYEPARSPYALAVAASGVVEPAGGTISLSSDVGGLIAEVFVEAGQSVEHNQPVVRFDDRQLQAELVVRQAALEVARAQLARIESPPRAAQLAAAKARLEEVEARLRTYEDSLMRNEKLFHQNSATEQQVVEDRYRVQATTAQCSQAKAELQLLEEGASDPERVAARAAVAEAQSQVDLVRTALDRLTIRAPCDAIVLSADVRTGESASPAAGKPLLLLAPTSGMFIRVDLDEHDLPRFHPEEPACARAKSQAVTLPLRFVRIEPVVVPKPPRNGPHDQVDMRVLQVIYEIDIADDQQVYIGQQLDVFIQSRAADAAGHSID